MGQVIVSQSRERLLLAGEVSFLLSLSNAYSLAFRFKRYRVRLWEFLGVALDLEQNGIIANGDLLTSESLKELATPTGKLVDPRYWPKAIAKDFLNDDGHLFDTIYKPGKGTKNKPPIQGYKFNDHYTKATKIYVKTFASMQKVSNKANKLNAERCREIYKKLLQFQVREYVPHRSTLINSLSKVAETKGCESVEISKTFRRGVNWVILNLLFRAALQSEERPWDTDDINREATKILVNLNPNEAALCLKRLTSEKSGKLLLGEKVGRGWYYSFNKKDYDQPFVEYAQAAVGIRTRLLALWEQSLR